MSSITSLRARIEADPMLRQVIAAVLEGQRSDPAHDLAHALRVAVWTLRICKSEAGESVCEAEPLAAALLHDLVNIPKDHGDRAWASVRSAEAAGEVLSRAGFSREATSRISTAIEDHSTSRGAVPQSLLGRALQDADRLDALGALGIARCFGTGNAMGSRIAHDDDPFAEARELDDRAYSVDHFFTKLLTLPERMCTTLGRDEGRARAAYLRGFLEQLARELNRDLDAGLASRLADTPRKR